MATGKTNAGGGGAALNFKVVPNPQPSVAKENTIWVDTDRINNYYFSATQPEGMVDYDVWFPVGTSSTVEFNALKKGGIQVYPLSAQQMVSGVLKDVTAKSYKGGAWDEWIVYIFNSDSDAIEFTVGRNSSNGKVNFTSGKIAISYSEATASDVVITKKEPVYIRKGSVISVTAKFTEIEYGSYDIYPAFGIAESIPKSFTNLDETNMIAYTEIKKESTAKNVYTLKLDSYEGEYYFVFYSAASIGEIFEITVRYE